MKEQLHVIDFEGEIYLRQERGGMLLGTYERACQPWSERETPWDFGQDLLPPDLDRIAPARDRLQAFPGDRPRRHQADHQRPLHLRAGRQPAGRAGARLEQFLGRLRRDGGLQPGRRRRPRARQLDDGRRSGLRRLGDGRRALRRLGDARPTPTPRCARTIRAASASASRTRSCRRRGRCGRRRSTIA